jgi:dTDP-glucose pyrophosphorylase
MTNEILLIPSAVTVPDELKHDLSSIPTGMIPIGGEPMISHISEQYPESLSVFIACDKNENHIKEYISRRQTDNMTDISVKNSDTLGETVLSALRSIEQKVCLEDTHLYINFADTIVSPIEELRLEDSVSVSPVENPIRWTVFRESDGRIDNIVDKESINSFDYDKAFTGVFSFTNPKLYIDCLERSSDSHGENMFYSALGRYIMSLDSNLVEPEKWVDTGHLDTYYQSKTHFLNSRQFNSFSIDNDIVKKKSSGGQVQKEKQWYENIPIELKKYTPRLHDCTEDELRIEYVGYPLLRELYLYGDHELHIWNSVYDSIFKMIDNFSKHEVTSPNTDHLKQMYVDKSINRLSDIEEKKIKPFFNSPVEINGTERPSINTVIRNIPNAIDSSGLLDSETFSVIHGDLHFSNMFFDIRSQKIKLVDPRGEFGDKRYDIAKLRHSVVGGYDFIINDRFNISLKNSDSVEYNLHKLEKHRQREELFTEWLSSIDVSEEQIKLLESLLWLSMTPLHKPTRRQLYMICHGLEMFDDAQKQL